MKPIRYFPLLAALALGSLCTAQEPANDREADHQLLRDLMAKATKAINGQDLDTLASCMSAEFAFTTADQSILRNKEELKSYYDDILSGARYEYPLESIKLEPKADILTRFIGEDSGYCYGTCVSTYTIPGGRSLAVDSRWTALVTKEAGEWKVKMAHAGVNFIDNPVLDVKDKVASTKFTAALVVAGIAILASIALLLRNRKAQA